MDLVFNVSVSTHNGKVRDRNEDNYSINGIVKPVETNVSTYKTTLDNDCLLVELCDGMGGEANGEIASKIAVDASRKLFYQLKKSEETDIKSVVNEYVNNVNKQICDMLENSKCSRGGSTLALVCIKENMVYPFSLGDSRIYIYRNGHLIQISEDHTLAMKKYKANIYTMEEAALSPDSHKLTLFLGVDSKGLGLNAVAYEPFEIMVDDVMLLCSDGMYDMCTNDEISTIIEQNLDNSSDELVNLALSNGGIDNVTCLLIRCFQGDNSVKKHEKKTILSRIKQLFANKNKE